MDMSPAPAAGTCARSTGTLHDRQQVSRFSPAKRCGSGVGPGPGPGVRYGGVVCGVPGRSGYETAWATSLVTPWCAEGEVPTGVNLNRHPMALR